MVKVTEDSRSEQDFPLLRWEQDVPTGESLHAVEQSMGLKIATVVMVFVFAAVYAASEQMWAGVIAAVVVGGVMLRGDQMLKSGLTVWGVHVKGPEPPPGAAEAERRARATPLFGKEFCKALVLPHEKTKELFFSVFRGTDPGDGSCVGSVPLDSIQAFELGTAEEWFRDFAQGELRRMGPTANSWVIVAPTLGHGLLPVAESGGTKAAIAALHGLLTKRFVIAAPEMQERWKEKLEEAGERPGQPS
jgi:hypothetical protein